MLNLLLAYVYNPIAGYCLTTKHLVMRPEKNNALISVLDSEQIEAPQQHVAPNMLQPITRDLDNDEEHLSRLRAEADADDKAQRLRVAQEQLAEYAAQKEQDTSAILQHAEALEQVVAQLLNNSTDASLSTAVVDSLQQLKAKLVDATTEATAFAAQQRDDVERAKRSFQQANMPEDMDIEMKRARETPEADSMDASTSQTAEASESTTLLPAAVEGDSTEEGAPATAAAAANGDAAGNNMQASPSQDGSAASDEEAVEEAAATTTSGSSSNRTFEERAKYIPIRLAPEERRLLRLLEAALHVSEYTDKVDILSWRTKNQRIVAQIKDLCAILSGLMVAHHYKRGQELVNNKNFADNADFFQGIFEMGRRYKIMNPDKMRSEYGKLMYLLMDSAEPNIQELLDFKCVCPLKTVYSVLEEGGALPLLKDPLLQTATAEIIAGDRPRYLVQKDIKTKERAREQLSRRYRTSALNEEALLNAIYSLSDNNSFLLFNRDPIDRMIAYFKASFSPSSHPEGCSLAIQGGRGGARLTHTHERQYHYVLQSLTLWREISTDMFRLWYLAEADMLREGNSYRLTDTGQGLNRVQPAPGTSRAIHQVLHHCQHSIGHWVGSSVVHLGDHNVPNALMFIDKYTQVPRILNPVVLVLDELPKLHRDPHLRRYIDATFGGIEECRMAILADFCRHAFDGSGADNFFDAGSCIDGRLTSAWNWCSKLEKKAYFPVFRLAGFTSFDGDFQK